MHYKESVINISAVLIMVNVRQVLKAFFFCFLRSNKLYTDSTHWFCLAVSLTSHKF
jgi:hypothetical protein